MKKFLAALTVLVVFAVVAIPNFVDARFFFFNWKSCEECDGSGLCPNCHGIGRIVEEYYDERAGGRAEHGKGPCYVCDATGKCQTCGGSGKVIDPDD